MILLTLLLLTLLALLMLGGSRGEARCLSKLGLGCGYASAAERESPRRGAREKGVEHERRARGVGRGARCEQHMV